MVHTRRQPLPHPVAISGSVWRLGGIDRVPSWSPGNAGAARRVPGRWHRRGRGAIPELRGVPGDEWPSAGDGGAVSVGLGRFGSATVGVSWYAGIPERVGRAGLTVVLSRCSRVPGSTGERAGIAVRSGESPVHSARRVGGRHLHPVVGGVFPRPGQWGIDVPGPRLVAGRERARRPAGVRAGNAGRGVPGRARAQRVPGEPVGWCGNVRFPGRCRAVLDTRQWRCPPRRSAAGGQ